MHLKKSCTERKCWNATTSHREFKHDRLDHNLTHMLTVSLAIDYIVRMSVRTISPSCCELTGDSTHRESVNMHKEEDAVGSKAMC